jgi:hypothetical protein
VLIIWVLSDVIHLHILVQSLYERCVLTRISHLDRGHVVVIVMEVVIVLRMMPVVVHVALYYCMIPNSSLGLCIFVALPVQVLVICCPAASAILCCFRKLLTAPFSYVFSFTFNSFEL